MRVLHLSLAAASICGAARAQAGSDILPLGRSAATGAVCRAARDYYDPAAATPGARVWSIRCLGWDITIGHIYRLRSGPDVAAWREGLKGRATCTETKSQTLQGFSGVERTLCRLKTPTAPYIAYEGPRGRFTLVAEGFAQAADILETGLRVTAGVLPPPRTAQAETSQAAAEVASEFGGELTGLDAARKSSQATNKLLLERGYLQNSEWRFDAAESDFRTLLAASRREEQAPANRALAILNLALNVSNDGRFEEAGAIFAEADPFIAAASDPDLRAVALTYRAYHLRNQRDFKGAIALAEEALAARARAAPAGSRGPQERSADGAPSVGGGEGGGGRGEATVIDAGLANALNERGRTSALTDDDPSPAGRLLLEDVQTLEIEGSSKIALQDLSGAAQTLEAAAVRLRAARELGGASSQLTARVEADLGDLGVAAGHPETALPHYQDALALLRARHAGSAPVGALLMDLGKAEILTGQTEAALQSYQEAFATFKSSRGSLGESADRAQPYLDLLLALQAKDPDHAAAYADRFFAATEAVVSDATAATISRLAARVASGDDITAGLVRAVDDTRRDLRAAEGRIAALQAQNAYSGAARASADSELSRLEAQLSAVNSALLEANPRYQELVASSATLADIQKALRPDEVYLKTLFLDGRGYGILVSRQAAAPYAIDAGRSQVVAAARALRAPMESAGEALDAFDVAGAHQLFKTLFGPVSAGLLGARHLVYEPDIHLVSLPVAVFVTDEASVSLIKARRSNDAGMSDYRGVSWLGDRLDSSLALSAVSFLQSRRFKPSRAVRPYIAFADPRLARTEPQAYARFLAQGAEELERSTDPSRAQRICGASRAALLKLEDLPDTGEEAHIVAASLGATAGDVVSGPAFTEAAVRGRRDLDAYKVVYFATHALLPMPDACLPEPALLTSPGPAGGEGLIAASEIVKLKLDADLVVLSACDTGGSGSDDGLAVGGEALGGLTRAFIYAGARGLIVSHWAVDSAATETLMTHLFEAGASTQAEGLQTTQEHMQRSVKTSHPYFWAPFTLVGDGSRPIPSAQLASAAAAASSSTP